MKFSTSFSTLLVLAPFLASQVSALTVPDNMVFRRRDGGPGGAQGGANFGNAHSFAAGGAAGGAAGAAAGAAAAQGSAASSAAVSATASAAAAATGTASAAAATATAAAGAGAAAGGNEQTSLTLDPAVIAPGFAQNGQAANGSEAGQVASLTSTNNFINFCASVNQPITNGQQVTGGSCNPAPMGSIPSTANMPSAKFQFPTNMGNVAANTPFTISMAINNLATGNFVNADSNYFSAPQQLNAQGQIVGHSHVVVEQLDSLTQTTPTDPTKFAFFKGLNAAAQGGVLTADVTSGLPAGTYKLSSINTAANHQPALVPIAQHGSLDDAVYFTVGGAGAAAANATAAGGAAAASASVAATSAAPAASAAVGAAGAAAAAAAAKGAAANGAATSSAAPAATAAAGAAAQGGAGAGAGAQGAPQENNAAVQQGQGHGRGRRFLREY